MTPTRVEKKEYIEYLFECRDSVTIYRKKLFSRLVSLEMAIKDELGIPFMSDIKEINSYKVEINNYLETKNEISNKSQGGR